MITSGLVAIAEWEMDHISGFVAIIGWEIGRYLVRKIRRWHWRRQWRKVGEAIVEGFKKGTER